VLFPKVTVPGRVPDTSPVSVGTPVNVPSVVKLERLADASWDPPPGLNWKFRFPVVPLVRRLVSTETEYTTPASAGTASASTANAENKDQKSFLANIASDNRFKNLDIQRQ
jgi:hypothetical protein